MTSNNYGYGGVIYVSNQRLCVTGAIFHDNTALYGGAIYCATAIGTGNPAFDNDCIISDSTFYNYTATYGGGIYVSS